MAKHRKLFVSLKPKTTSDKDDPVEDLRGQYFGGKDIFRERKPAAIREPNRKWVNKKPRYKTVTSNKSAAAILHQNVFDLKSRNEEALYWVCVDVEEELCNCFPN